MCNGDVRYAMEMCNVQWKCAICNGKYLKTKRRKKSKKDKKEKKKITKNKIEIKRHLKKL